jgi:hypothetical protein
LGEIVKEKREDTRRIVVIMEPETLMDARKTKTRRSDYTREI